MLDRVADPAPHTSSSCGMCGEPRRQTVGLAYCPEGVSDRCVGVLFCPCVENGPEVATNDIAKAGVSRRQLGLEVRAKNMSERERRRQGVPTPESFRGASS